MAWVVGWRGHGCRGGRFCLFFFFFFNDTATTEIYTLSLHDALPILSMVWMVWPPDRLCFRRWCLDRKSTRLNSSHLVISYAVFCLKKKTEIDTRAPRIKHTISPPPSRVICLIL